MARANQAYPDLATPQDRKNLGTQSFLADLARHLSELISLGRHVHAAVQSIMGSAPAPSDILDAVVLAMFRDGIFATIVAGKPHMNTALFQGYAEALARVLLDDHWDAISR
jgi:hypothetical protein